MPASVGVGASKNSASSSSAASNSKPLDAGNSALSVLEKGEHDAFIFSGSVGEVGGLKMLLAFVDRPAGEVFIRGMVYEVTYAGSEGSAVGLAMSILNGRVGASIGLLKNLGNSVTVTNNGMVGVNAIFSMLSADSRFKVLSAPSVRVKSGSVGSLSAGQDVPVLGAIQTSATGLTTQSVEYKPSGVIFSITPDVREESIDLNVRQQISNFSVTVTGVNGSPTLSKREITTSISVADGEIIMLGGLTEEKVSQDFNGFSFLPDWTQSKSEQRNKSEVILVVQVQKI